MRDTWDKPLSDNLREEAIKLFKDYVELGCIKFHRSLTPADHNGKPWGITFSDGSDKAYGAVLYLRWNTSQGIVIRFVESKAKLAPLNQKGDAIKAEVCGAVFASRLKKYFEAHGRMEVERWFHFVDSQTILGAIQRESYGYQTFFANWVGEIQKAGPVEDWWWIPCNLNVADIITRGGSPEEIKEGSLWQEGPKFLRWPVNEWPIKSAGEVADKAREGVNKFQRKAFVATATRSKQKQRVSDSFCHPSPAQNGISKGENPPAGWSRNLIEVQKFSTLTRLIGVTAWVWRAAKKWLNSRTSRQGQEKDNVEVLTAKERKDALTELIHVAQKNATFPETALKRLVVYRNTSSGLLVCGGRIQACTDDEAAVPILPYDAWLSLLIAREAHKVNHEGLAGTLIRMREWAWILKGQRLIKKVVDSCVTCRKARAKRCKQIMSDLPPERTSPAKPFEFTSVDFFGPYKVKDQVKKRVTLKVWGIVFCCMASRAIHTDVLSDQSSEGFLLAYQRFTSLRGHLGDCGRTLERILLGPSQYWRSFTGS